MNGTHVVYDGKTILDHPFSAERVTELMAHFDSYRCSYTFVGKTHGWARNLPEIYLERLNILYGLPDFLNVNWEPGEVQANMIDFTFQTEEDFERCRPAFSGSMVLNRHPGQLSADLSFKEHDKSKGIEAFLNYAGIDKNDTIAFGDGYNDITMMSAVGCGIAMGNAVDAVKEAADYVTSDVFEDGIYHALKHFELI
jgi:hydroxymethylpyrimidine pyrophosphatase-like HAD family hydrolase